MCRLPRRSQRSLELAICASNTRIHTTPMHGCAFSAVFCIVTPRAQQPVQGTSRPHKKSTYAQPRHGRIVRERRQTIICVFAIQAPESPCTPRPCHQPTAAPPSVRHSASIRTRPDNCVFQHSETNPVPGAQPLRPDKTQREQSVKSGELVSNSRDSARRRENRTMLKGDLSTRAAKSPPRS